MIKYVSIWPSGDTIWKFMITILKNEQNNCDMYGEQNSSSYK